MLNTCMYKNTGIQEYKMLNTYMYKNTGIQEYNMLNTCMFRNTGIRLFHVPLTYIVMAFIQAYLIVTCRNTIISLFHVFCTNCSGMPKVLSMHPACTKYAT